MGANIARALKAHPDGHFTTNADGTRTVVKRWLVDHFLEDLEPVTYCCTWSNAQQCSKYTLLRVPSYCTNFTYSLPGNQQQVMITNKIRKDGVQTKSPDHIIVITTWLSVKQCSIFLH